MSLSKVSEIYAVFWLPLCGPSFYSDESEVYALLSLLPETSLTVSRMASEPGVPLCGPDGKATGAGVGLLF